MTRWTEIGPGIFTRSHGQLDVAVSVILGPEGVVVVDALADPASGATLRAELASLSRLPLVALVLTHAHYDHTFGLAGLLSDDPGVLVLAHAGLEAHLREHEAAELEAGRRGDLALARQDDWDDVELPVPDVAIAEPRELELGGRSIALWPLRTAHSTCDLVAHVPDAGVWLVGDVVEESGPPSFETDSDPEGWASELELLTARLGARDVVVPGHGAPVGAGFVATQASLVRAVADRAVEVRAGGLGEDELVRALRADTGWPAGTLRAAAAVALARLSERA